MCVETYASRVTSWPRPRGDGRLRLLLVEAREPHDAVGERGAWEARLDQLVGAECPASVASSS